MREKNNGACRVPTRACNRRTQPRGSTLVTRDSIDLLHEIFQPNERERERREGANEARRGLLRTTCQGGKARTWGEGHQPLLLSARSLAVSALDGFILFEHHLRELRFLVDVQMRARPRRVERTSGTPSRDKRREAEREVYRSRRSFPSPMSFPAPTTFSPNNSQYVDLASG